MQQKTSHLSDAGKDIVGVPFLHGCWLDHGKRKVLVRFASCNRQSKEIGEVYCET